jgi:hypothetical protein
MIISKLEDQFKKFIGPLSILRRTGGLTLIRTFLKKMGEGKWQGKGEGVIDGRKG